MRKKNPILPQRTLFGKNIGAKDNIIDNIIKAGKEKKTVTITYTDSKGQVTVRETEPYEIKGDKYYGFSLDKNAIRSFTIGNISSVTVNDRTFVPRWEVKF
jgi:predicted DNA-binding transcriptional regulator YafY